MESTAGRWRLFCRTRDGRGTVVMIHGLGLSGEFYRGAFEHPALAERGLFILDLVGFGQTGAPPSEFDFELASQAKAVWDALDELGIREVSLVGHSMGGTVAACMAIQRPQAVHCLIVAEGNLVREPSAWSARISAAGEDGFAAEFQELLDSGRFPSMRQTTISTFVRSARSLQETPDRENFRIFFEQKSVPVFFLRGEQPASEVETLKLCEELGIPVRTIPGSGHFFTEDNPGGFYQTIAEILAAEEERAQATQKLGDSRLTLLHQISRSNIATVWEAYDSELDRKVLVKYIAPQYSRDQDIRARFLREARAIAKLSHPNVVQIYDLRSDEEQLSLILEFVEGQSLRRLLKERGPFPSHVAVTMAAHIAAGLENAHAAGIIHRDLKPENVMVSGGAEVKITDFGLVTLRDQPTLTQEGMLVGTPSYMAPEQVEGSELTPATDIFALGLILLEMLTGRRLFERSTLQATLQAVQNYKQLQAEDLGEAVPSGLLPVIAQMLERSPAKRFRKAAEVREALVQTQPEGLLPRTLLADFLSGKPVRRATVPSVARARAWSWPLRAAATLVLLLAGVAVVFHFATLTRESPEIQGLPVGPFESGVPSESPPPRVLTPGEAASPTTSPEIPTGTPPVVNSREREGTGVSVPPVTLAANGYLALTTRPWASVYIGDSLVGTTPLPGRLSLRAGRQRVLLLNPEIGIPVQREVEIRPNETTGLAVNLYDHVARIRIASVKPWADVYVNGEFILRTPSSKIIFKPPGTYQITLRNPDFAEYTETVTLREGDPVREIRVDLSQR
jgi:serine/threonine protein kinase/pimeloyl-ACP methyl ester carboxylesterase